MNELQIFNNAEFGDLRVVMKDGEYWFVGKDVAEMLGYSNARDALNTHIDIEDKRIIQKSENATFEIPNRGLILINESGLYSLILSSKLPKAKEFKRWVTSEVLPSIRKIGSYSVKTNSEEFSIKRDEVQIEKSKLWLQLADRVDIPEYKKIAESYAFNTLAGKNILPLPEMKQKTYSATEIANILGITAQKVGRLANANNLKTAKYGKLFLDKSPYSLKEVETFRYYENTISVFKSLIM